MLFRTSLGKATRSRRVRSANFPNMSGQSKRPEAVGRAVGSIIELLENRRLLSTLIFKDDYSTDKSANYTESDQTAPPTLMNTWTIANGTLNYNVTATNGWNSSVFLLKPSVANTGGLFQFQVSGDIIKGGDPVTSINLQPGLIISGDTTSGGFVVMEYDNGAFANHLVLLQETGTQLLGDEGGVGNPPVVFDFGDISTNLEDTFHIVANVDRTGANPVFNIAITDLTTPSFTIAPATITDMNVPANYGGTQIGWRARYDTSPAGFSVDNLELDNTIASADHAPAAPTIGTPTYAKGAVTVNFTDNADNEVGFTVERSTDGVNFSSVGTLGPLAGTGLTGAFVDTNVKPNTTYTYRVGAVNGFMGGTTSESGTVSVSTPANFPGWVYSGYSSDTMGNYPFDGDSVSTQEQFSADGKIDEGAMPTGTAVLGYQELLSHVIDFSGNDAVAPPGAPATFNTIQGAGMAGHQFALRFSGTFTPTVTGYYTLGISTDDGGSASWANGDGSNPVTLTPVGLTRPADNLTTLRGNTLDVDPVVDGSGNPVQWIAGHQYELQFDQNNNGGGWDVHAYYAISSSAANQGSQMFDVKGQTLISPGDVSPGVPVFKTIDFANPSGLAKDAAYYMGMATGGAGSVLLSFSNIAADSYNIYRATAAGGPYTKVSTSPVLANTGGITYTDTGLSGGTTYFYIVTGVNISGETPQASGLHLSATPTGGGPQDTINGTSGNDAITLKQDADHAHIDWTFGAQSGQLPINNPHGLTINGNGGSDTITFDNSNGNPLPDLLVLNQTGAGSKFEIQGLQAIGAGQKVDIQSSTVQVDYTGASPLSTIQGDLAGGQIFSSTLASNPKFAIADDDSADPLNSGQAANTILLRPAIIGNATLNGKVGFSDLVQLARNYGKSNADWAMGDFNYDGKVGFDDLVPLARNYNQSGPATTAAALTPAVSADTGTLPKNRRPLSTRL